ncbi:MULTISPECIES: LCP family protein [unclassified Rhodococcus (in: high G+C Gram-positive bacteria)]|uniref:LCP family protein n=1 Tax=unclassified Rhodococcus (in: high G+C Gram-positive bacteria) TaxID=192944 RepID=UPI001FF8B450|nr:MULTISPECIES: LCP family protein [unclassified Rhodococcus (in: high G+C Gram-positive bacteria)]
MTSHLNTSDALSALGADASGSSRGDSNILLIGLDSRKAMDGSDLPAQFVTDQLHAGDSDVGGYNTNTLILLHVPGNGDRASAVSIPRDDYVSVPGYGMRKIKEAYGLAKFDEDQRLTASGMTDPTAREQQGREVGRRSTLSTVQNLLHVPIDHFAEVNLMGFYDIAAALGPLKVCLNSSVDDSEYSGANFPAGKQSLDAAQVLAFVRQRHGLDNGDLDRTRRQQAFISAVVNNLESSGVVGNISKMQALTDVVDKDIVIDANMDPVKFASQAGNLTDGKLDFYTLPIESYETIDDQSVNIIDPARLRAEVSALFDGASPAPMSSPIAESTFAFPPERADVLDIRNGTGREGLAATVAAKLTAEGYTVDSVGNSESTTSTTIAYGADAVDTADSLVDQWGTTDSADDTLSRDHVSIVLGSADVDRILTSLVPPLASPAPTPATSAVIPTTGAQGAPMHTDSGDSIPCVD